MLGDLEPAHATAAGKALLADRDSSRESLLAQPLRRDAPRTLTYPRDRAAERARVRAPATDHGEHHEDVHAIAAPVFQADDAIAALVISLSDADHTTADANTLAAHTIRAAASLTAALSRHA